jgi:putative SOS response-associated peptidase YedK
MCGRYSLSTPLEELIETFDVVDVVLGDYRPRYNIAPTQDAPVLVRAPNGLRLGAMRWGLVPAWAQSLRVGNRMINARSETAASLPAFREAFRRRRCLVPADGFYEWRTVGAAEEPGRRPRARKIPYWIHEVDGGAFTFAGIWERWRPQGGAPVHTFAILTTRVSERLAHLHDRMPVVIPPSSHDLWLDPDADAGGIHVLLGPAPDALFDAWPVSNLVDAPSRDDPACVLPRGDDDVLPA